MDKIIIDGKEYTRAQALKLLGGSSEGTVTGKLILSLNGKAIEYSVIKGGDTDGGLEWYAFADSKGKASKIAHEDMGKTPVSNLRFYAEPKLLRKALADAGK